MEKSGKHFHHGRSSRQILNPSKVLSAIGLKEGETFLDAGSGDGYMSIAASSIVGENGKVYSIDIYEESMNNLINEIENQKIKNITPIVADISEKIPIENGIIDICYMANVLHGFVENKDVDEVMKEIIRIIKPKGIFTVVEFKKEDTAHGPPLNVRITPEEVKNIVENYDLTVKSIEDVGKYHYTVIASKK